MICASVWWCRWLFDLVNRYDVSAGRKGPGDPIEWPHRPPIVSLTVLPSCRFFSLVSLPCACHLRGMVSPPSTDYLFLLPRCRWSPAVHFLCTLLCWPITFIHTTLPRVCSGTLVNAVFGCAVEWPYGGCSFTYCWVWWSAVLLCAILITFGVFWLFVTLLLFYNSAFRFGLCYSLIHYVVLGDCSAIVSGVSGRTLRYILDDCYSISFVAVPIICLKLFTDTYCIPGPSPFGGDHIGEDWVHADCSMGVYTWCTCVSAEQNCH